MPDTILRLTTAIFAGLVLVTAASLPTLGQPGVKKAVIEQGHALFLINCSSCHGANAEGDDGPSLHQKNLSDSFIAAAIRGGFKNEMPPFRSLKAAEVKALTAYVHTLQK